MDTRTLEAVVICLGQVFFLAGPQKGFRHVLKRDSKRMLRAMAEPLLDQLWTIFTAMAIMLASALERILLLVYAVQIG